MNETSIPKAVPPEAIRLISTLRAQMPMLVAHYHVRSLELFGSYIHNAQRADSDLDILVEFDEPPSLFEFVRLEDHLSDTLGVKVDLVMKDALKPDMGKRILREAVPV
jgi:predicted nucleotidyltransferase